MMGVKNWSGLIPWRWVEISELEPPAIAIDLPNYLARRMSVLHSATPDRISLMHLHIALTTIRASLKKHILPVFVFDGPPEHLKRRPNPQLVSRAERLYAEYAESHGSENSQIAAQLNESRALRFYFSINHVRDFCSHAGVPAISSPSEAELAAAILCREGRVGSVVSNDADALLFGSPHVIRSLRFSKGQIERARLADLEDVLELNRDQLRDLAIICGCDFHKKGVPGLGPRRGAVQLRRHGDLVSVLKAQGLSREAIKEYTEAREVFDEGEYLQMTGVDLSLKPPLKEGLARIVEPAVGVARVQKVIMELVRLWKDFGKVQTTLESWI